MSYPKYEKLMHTWRKYISGNDDPNRPTENTAFKNLRYAAKVADWTCFIRQFEVINGSYQQNMASSS